MQSAAPKKGRLPTGKTKELSTLSAAKRKILAEKELKRMEERLNEIQNILLDLTAKAYAGEMGDLNLKIEELRKERSRLKDKIFNYMLHD